MSNSKDNLNSTGQPVNASQETPKVENNAPKKTEKKKEVTGMPMSSTEHDMFIDLEQAIRG